MKTRGSPLGEVHWEVRWEVHGVCLLTRLWLCCPEFSPAEAVPANLQPSSEQPVDSISLLTLCKCLGSSENAIVSNDVELHQAAMHNVCT